MTLPPSCNDKYHKILQDARNTAQRDHRYASAEIRQRLTLGVEAAFGRRPYDWQLDVSEALILGLDCIAIAGTGAGKTLPFVMPLLLDENKDKIILIISPLNDLQHEQAERFRSMGITATPVNRDMCRSNPSLHEDILHGKFRVLISSPEMCFENYAFSQLLRSPEFTNNFFSIVIDEAHCIPLWRTEFREKFGELCKLRSLVSSFVPILATSATLCPDLLQDVKTQLCLLPRNTFMINLGNDRMNITPLVVRMHGAASDLDALSFLTHELSINGERNLEPTIVFFNTRDLAQDACLYLRGRLPEEMRDQVDFITAGRSPAARKQVMQKFRDGPINILCATEAAGMGLDIQRLRRVVQFMVPSSLTAWFQRLGRAGRNGLPAIAILLVEPSVFKKVKARPPKSSIMNPTITPQYPDEDAELDDEDTTNAEDTQAHDSIDPTQSEASGPTPAGLLENMKTLEVGMRAWIETKTCRRDIANQYFCNGPTRRDELTVPCCDVCLIRRRDNPDEDMSDSEKSLLATYTSLQSRSQDPPLQEAESESQCTEEKKPRRYGEALKACREALMVWRDTCWKRHYSRCIWGRETLLPDQILKSIASRMYIRTVEQLSNECQWIWAEEHGEEVLEVVKQADEHVKAVREEEKARKKLKRSRVTMETKVIRDEERREEKRIKTAIRNASKQVLQSQPIPQSTNAYPIWPPVFHMYVPGTDRFVTVQQAGPSNLV